MPICSNCMAEVPAGEEVLVAGKNRREPNTILCANCASTVDWPIALFAAFAVPARRRLRRVKA